MRQPLPIGTRPFIASAQGIEGECTDRKDSLDDEIMILFQCVAIRLGEARAQLLVGISLVELESKHRKLKPSKQPQKALSGRRDFLLGLGVEHLLEGLGIGGMCSEPCTNLLDVSIHICLDGAKGRGTEDVCGTTGR